MLAVRGVRRAYDGVPVLKGLDLDVERGEIVCLLGPSGCGKTTLLRLIAGLETPDAGDIEIDGHAIVGVPVHERGFGLMFQDFALFPHMNVAGNIRFGLRMRHTMNRMPRAEQDTRVSEMLALVGLQGFEKRDVTSLSGGERQRVALARSLAPSPRLLMLDEPLGALDATLRERLVVELHDIIKSVDQTALYVTHDQREAYAIADRVAVMNAGQFEQIAAPEHIYRHPATPFVARFLGLNNLVPVIRVAAGNAETPLGRFPVETPTDTLLWHPDGIRVVSSETPGAIPVTLTECTFLGDGYRLEALHTSGITLTFRHRPDSVPLPARGDTVFLTISPSAIIPL